MDCKRAAVQLYLGQVQATKWIDDDDDDRAVQLAIGYLAATSKRTKPSRSDELLPGLGGDTFWHLLASLVASSGSLPN